MTKIIVDPGSNHNGDYGKAIELIKIAADCGADAVKFQLLTQKELKGTGNIELPWKWLPELIDHGKIYHIEVFASVFNEDGIKWLRACKCKSIKFAYSQQKYGEVTVGKGAEFEKIYMSCDVMTKPEWPKKDCLISLYCIPLYPVPYIVDFEGLFPRFDGWSSHTLGIKQDMKAISMGAKYVEKHFQCDWHSPTPDGKFSIRPKELRKLCDYAHKK